MAQFFGSKQAVMEFEKIESVKEKIKMLWTLPLMQDLLSSSKGGGAHCKSEGDTRRWRELGNKSFQAGKDREAVTRFCNAVIAAPQTNGRGRDLSLALANRSAALLRLGYPELSLDDISLALESGYPPELTYKVLERKVRCLLLMRKEDTEMRKVQKKFEISLSDAKLEEAKKNKLILEISQLVERRGGGGEDKMEQGIVLSLKPEQTPVVQDPNPVYPAFSSAVKIEHDKTRGRYGRATRDIVAGTVILVESPSVSCLNASKLEDHCSHCMVSCPLRQVPCTKCVLVRYCSLTCRDAATSYHRYECGLQDPMVAILGKISDDGHKEAINTKNYHNTCYRAVAQTPLDWLRKHRKELENITEESFTGKDGLILEPGSLIAAYSLVGHRRCMTLKRMNPLLMSAVFQLRSLQLLGYFPAIKSKVPATLTEEEAWVGELLYCLFEKMQWNTHAVVEGLTDYKELEEEQGLQFQNRINTIGTGVYPSLAMLNHSCNNNVQKYFVGTTAVVMSSKLIRAGEEITENYHPLAMVMERPERRKWLSLHYKFDCACIACIDNLPDIRSISNKVTRLRCPNSQCKEIVVPGGVAKCPACSTSVLSDKLIAELMELEAALTRNANKLRVWETPENLASHYEEMCGLYKRLEAVVSHPYKLLFKAEQQYWRAQRLAFGNKSYIHQGEGGRRYRLPVGVITVDRITQEVV